MQNKPQSVSSEPGDVLLRRLRDFYEHFSLDTITCLDELYTQDIEFISPAGKIQGSLALKNHLKKALPPLRHYRICFRDCLAGEHCAYLSWALEYAHPKIASGRIVRVEGMSHLLFTNRVYHQENRYDMGAMLYDHLPLLGRATGFARKRLDLSN